MPAAVTVRKEYCRYRRGLSGYLYNMWEARRRQSDLNHITGDVHYLALALSGRRTILTIHDCGTLHQLTGWRRRWARLLWFEWPVRRVAAVTVISEATRRELLAVTSCPAAKVTVIPDPLPSGFSAHPKTRLHEVPRLLQIGTRANKNVERLAAALAGIPCHLTLVGHLTGQQRNLLDSNRVSYSSLADISDANLLSLYRDTDLVMFCSTYEGFGLPVIEAQGVGRAVVASDIEPIREIAGDAACLVDPYSFESIRAGVLRVLGDSRYREDLIARGFENAARFEARTVAGAYHKLYQKMLAAGTGNESGNMRHV